MGQPAPRVREGVERLKLFKAPPSLTDIRRAINFWKSDDAPGDPELRAAAVAELEWIEFQWRVLSN
jgi:hypothetical protein